MLDQESIREGPTTQTVRRRGEDWWDDTQHYSGCFSCLMQCGNCQQTVAVAGASALERVNPRLDEYEPIYYPKFFSPAPDLFRIPPNCPEPLVEHVRAAFYLYWCDRAACLNRLRAMIELLLDEMEINREENGQWLSPHKRIGLLQERHPGLRQLCDRLMAVKWLGNAGSHLGIITHDDIFDAFDIVEAVLHELFDKSDHALNKMVREIIEKKAPRSREQGAG